VNTRYRLCPVPGLILLAATGSLVACASRAVPPAEFTCDDGKTLTIQFHNEREPPEAVLVHGGDREILSPRVSASGSRYGREGVDFWEHQGEATVDLHGVALKCRSVR
jgi:membrane-bound inhibitor of C-type lysozyme